jgi:hypothetical protein
MAAETSPMTLSAHHRARPPCTPRGEQHKNLYIERIERCKLLEKGNLVDKTAERFIAGDDPQLAPPIRELMLPGPYALIEEVEEALPVAFVREQFEIAPRLRHIGPGSRRCTASRSSGRPASTGSTTLRVLTIYGGWQVSDRVGTPIPPRPQLQRRLHPSATGAEIERACRSRAPL